MLFAVVGDFLDVGDEEVEVDEGVDEEDKESSADEEREK
jgi:hypothetical protein